MLSKSPTNPRRRRDPQKFEDLCASVKEKGIIQPIVTRQLGGGFEIVVGEGRYLAAQKAALETVPSMIRELSDLDVIEIQLIENRQREDINCLDEAEAYQRLVKGGYPIKRISQRVGLSEKYVYDRLKLLDLVPEAKSLVRTDRITPGHAILLARLKPQDQKRAIDPDAGGLFEGEHLLFNPHASNDETKKLSKDEMIYHDVKPRSVREFEGWIDQHVRFDRRTPDPMLFPQTSATLQSAAETKEKVIQITHEHYVQPDAKEGNTERIYSDVTWKLADGSGKDAKSCEKSVTGVVVIGPQRGAAYKVCVNKECMVHWAKEKRERERRAKMSTSQAESRQQREEAARLAERRLQELKREAWKKAAPAIVKATAEKVKTAKYGTLAQIIDRELPTRAAGQARALIGSAGNAERLLAIVALTFMIEKINVYWTAGEEFRPDAKLLGLDLKPLMAPEDAMPAARSSKKKTRAAA
jgi:ParB/RepB/Spo0J family partition protein